MLRDRSPSNQITLGLWISFISFILLVIDGFIGLGKGEADPSFNGGVAGHVVEALAVIFEILIFVGLVLIVVGIIRSIAGRKK